MKLHVKTPTPNLARSLDYWSRAGFAPTGAADGVVSDGQIVIHIDADKFARPGVVLTRESWADGLAALEPFGPLHDVPSGGRLVAAPSGTWVYLAEGPGFEATADGAEAALGNYAGLSIETTDIAASRRFWEALGLEKTQGDEAQGWISLEGHGGGISLMKPFACQHLFFSPGLTYFNGGKNPEILPKLRERGVEFAEEVTVFNPNGEVDNAILRDPGGLGVFVFND